MLQVLVSSGISIDVIDADANTPLHYAAQRYLPRSLSVEFCYSREVPHTLNQRKLTSYYV